MVHSQLTQKPACSFALASCWLLVALAARPDEPSQGALLPEDHTKASSMVEMASSGHMVKNKIETEAGAGDDPEVDLSEGGTAKAVEGDQNWEAKSLDPKNAIAHKEGSLAKLEGQYGKMKELFEDAAKKVWEDPKKMDKNFIAETGLEWMNKVQEFKVTASDLRKHAEEIYEDIVKSHTIAAKKQMKTFKKEMIKLKAVHDAHTAIAKDATDKHGKIESGELTAFSNERDESGRKGVNINVGDASLKTSETSSKHGTEKGVVTGHANEANDGLR